MRWTMARWSVGLLAVPAVVLVTGSSAFAADGPVSISNTETVQAYLDATGKLDVARVYEQIAMQGKGTVDLRNPVQADGLRNLDGFGGFEVKDGTMVGSYEVDGERRLRAVSSYDRQLPLDVSVKYFLEGKEVEPGEVVGQEGTLRVEYTVRNTTGAQQEVSFDDGTGKQVSSAEEVVIPMVGSLTTTLPAQFTDVRSEQANMAGDGRGGTKMTYTMTLFGPIGSPEAVFGYEAEITDGVIPSAVIAALPVSPLDSPSFKGGAASYKGGADTGVQLTAGAQQIDSNLLKLRDGAGELLAGLIQLRDGAEELRAGLEGQAAPGADRLADGAGQAKDGSGQLATGAQKAKDGSGQVADGAGQVADGAGRLDDGAGQLASGLDQASAKAPALLDGLAQVAAGLDRVDAGLVQLHGGIGQLPAKAKPLHDGIAQLKAGLGTKEDETTLIGGVDKLRQQIAAAGPGISKMEAGVYGTKGQSAYEKLGCAVKVLNDLNAGAAPGADPCYAATGGFRPPLSPTTDPTHKVVLSKLAEQLQEGRAKLADPNNTDPDIDEPLPDDATLQQGLAYLRGRLTERAVPGLVRIECGLSNTTLDGCDPKKPGLLEGILLVDAGVTQLVDGVVTQVQGAVGDDDDVAADETLRGGVHSLQGGVDQIGQGGATLIDGLARLSDGANQLEAGTGELAAGANRLSSGAGELDTGLGTLADGAGQLDNGLGDLKDGARQLADGLGDAANGSGRLADGLGKAAEGAPKIRDGAQRLSDEGTSKLIEAGKSTAADYGMKYALIEAGAQRAKTEGMAYGAPEGASAQTAYSLELAGVDGEAGRNVGRGLGAAAAFGMASLAMMARRRFV